MSRAQRPHLARVPGPARPRPRKTIAPSDRISRITASASVVLPEPLSPTMPSVSPARTRQVGVVHRLHVAHGALAAGRAGSGTRSSGARSAAISCAPGRHRLGLAGRLRPPAACGCRGAAGRRRSPPSGPVSTISPSFITQTRSAMRRTMARSWVMNSRHIPSSRFSSASRSRICAWIVTSSAVVGSSAISSFGLVGQRHGDHHALPLPAGQLVRIGAQPALRVADADLCQQLEDPRPRLVAAQALVQQQAFAQLLLQRVQRVERGHRLLEDEADVVAADLAQLGVRRRRPSRAPRSSPSPRHPRCRPAATRWTAR